MAKDHTDDRLASIPMFEDCSKKELRSISRLMTQITVPDGKTLIIEMSSDVRGHHRADFLEDPPAILSEDGIGNSHQCPHPVYAALGRLDNSIAE